MDRTFCRNETADHFQPQRMQKLMMTLSDGMKHTPIDRIHQCRGFPASLAAKHNALGMRLPVDCGLISIFRGLLPFFRGEWDMVVGSVDFLLCLIVDAVGGPHL